MKLQFVLKRIVGLSAVGMNCPSPRYWVQSAYNRQTRLTPVLTCDTPNQQTVKYRLYFFSKHLQRLNEHNIKRQILESSGYILLYHLGSRHEEDCVDVRAFNYSIIAYKLHGLFA